MNSKNKKSQISRLMILITVLYALSSASFAEVVWTGRAGMPTPRAAMSCSVVDGKIYAIGGRTNPRSGQSRVSTVEEYDPATNQWTRKTSMPTARYKLSTSIVEGKIYAIGGNPGGPATGVVEEYDPATDTWTRKTAMPEGQAGHSACVVNGKIYVIWGGTMQIYDPITDLWTRGTDRPN
jgi:N-acetylneuraminic acid mutarotase